MKMEAYLSLTICLMYNNDCDIKGTHSYTSSQSQNSHLKSVIHCPYVDNIQTFFHIKNKIKNITAPQHKKKQNKQLNYAVLKH